MIDDKFAKFEAKLTKKFGEEILVHPLEVEHDKTSMIEISGELEKKEQNCLIKQQTSGKIRLNRECEICSSYSLNCKDSLYLNKFKTCFKCYVEHIEDRPEHVWKERLSKLKENKYGNVTGKT